MSGAFKLGCFRVRKARVRAEPGDDGMTSSQIERIAQQFTRQREAYIAQPDVVDERALTGLAGLAGAAPGVAALDVACGPGFLSRALARAGARVCGIDATPTFIEHARSLSLRDGNLDTRFELGDAEQLPFEAAEFDLAICRSAYHHFPNPARVMAEMARVVRPGGRVVVADMLGSVDPAESKAQLQIEKLCDPTHERALTQDEFEMLGADAQLVLERSHIASLEHEVEEWIDHGGPTTEVADEIRALMASWAEHDRSGLGVEKREDGTYFKHAVAVFVFVKPVFVKPVFVKPGLAKPGGDSESS
jgi:ubiquinone/menaquinone biosynthesis C-methylase UbiE